jgi:hypothetical protein
LVEAGLADVHGKMAPWKRKLLPRRVRRLSSLCSDPDGKPRSSGRPHFPPCHVCYDCAPGRGRHSCGQVRAARLSRSLFRLLAGLRVWAVSSPFGAGVTARLAKFLMHRQANLGSVAFNQRPFFYFFSQVRRLTNKLRRRLNLSATASCSVIELLQTNLLRARHALGVMHFAPGRRQMSVPGHPLHFGPDTSVTSPLRW